MGVSETTASESWTTAAWNGVRFSHPRTWQMGRISTNHLVFVDGSSPLMEIKWRHTHRFNPRRNLARLARQFKRQHKMSIQSWDLPNHWQSAFDGMNFQCHGFKWQSRVAWGRVVVLYCAHCHTVTLFHFYGQGENPADLSYAPRLLSTFRDHRDDGMTEWSIFDISARLPAEYRLIHSRFFNGQFNLRFKHRRCIVDLYRWAPANILLTQHDLAGFGRQHLGAATHKTFHTVSDALDSVEWRREPASALQRRLRLGGGPAYSRLRLWHLTSRNRILGIWMRGGQPLNNDDFELIWERYEAQQT